MVNEKEQNLLNLIDQGQNDIIQCLQKLISFKTITPQDDEIAKGKDYKELQNYISNIIKPIGFEVETWEVDASKLPTFPGSGVKKDRDLSNMPVLAGTLKGSGGGKSLILNGHYDVVPPGVRKNWTHDPFGGEIANEIIYGRGSNDMKGGIAAMLQAIKFIKKAGIDLLGDVIIQTVPEEEASCMGTLSCCQRGYSADAAIIPEPTDMNVLVAVRGGVYGKITVFGRAGHAELTQPHWKEGGAVNAITKAMKIIQAFENLTEEWKVRSDKKHKFLDPDKIMATVIKGGEWVVTYPEKVEIEFGCQFIPATKNAIEEIKNSIDKVTSHDPWMRENPPKLELHDQWWYGAEISENEPIAKLGLEVLKEIGYSPKFRGFGSLTDCIHLINYSKIPTISLGPTIKTAHMADELVSIKELINTTKALALAIVRWCGNESK